MALDGNAVRSVDRAAALLLALGESQGEAGVTELARRLGLHKSTASRLLATLQKRGKTFLLVSHALKTVRENCDRTIWLHHGRVVCDGDTASVSEAYHQWSLGDSDVVG